MQDRHDPADDPLCREGWQVVASLRLRTPLVDEGDDLGEYAPPTLHGRSTRSKRADDQQPADATLHVEKREQAEEPCPQPLSPTGRRVMRIEHIARSPRDPLVERSQEAVFAIGEDLVERAARDTGTPDDMRDADIRHPALSALLDHRGKNARSLDVQDMTLSNCQIGPPGACYAKRAVRPRYRVGHWRRLCFRGHVTSFCELSPCGPASPSSSRSL